MAHDLLKLGLTLAVLVVLVAAMAMLVSSYLTAYKPANQTTQSQPTGISGGKSVGTMTPTPTPRPRGPPPVVYPQYQPPQAPVMLETPQAMAGMPPFEMPAPTTMPSIVPSRSPGFTPSTPNITLWYYIIQDLLRLFPGLFSGQFSAFPQWPRPWL